VANGREMAMVGDHVSFPDIHNIYLDIALSMSFTLSRVVRVTLATKIHIVRPEWLYRQISSDAGRGENSAPVAVVTPSGRFGPGDDVEQQAEPHARLTAQTYVIANRVWPDDLARYGARALANQEITTRALVIVDSALTGTAAQWGD
jgi:hypothetical protein